MNPIQELCAKVCVLMADEHTAASADCRANGNNAGALTRARQAQTANDCAIAIRALPRSEIDGAGGAVTLPKEHDMHPLIDLCAKVCREFDDHPSLAIATDRRPCDWLSLAADAILNLPQSEIDKAGEAVGAIKGWNGSPANRTIDWFKDMTDAPNGTLLYAAPAALPEQPSVSNLTRFWIHGGATEVVLASHYDALLAAALPDGYVRVPKEPTEEYLQDVMDRFHRWCPEHLRPRFHLMHLRELYAALLAAAQGEQK